ncbi:uncharacterized protein LOC108045211 isoform X3 [Drosophila rhopaloa]|uniref:Uncharacterized protein LOC108045211 isoform X3 n=1 Tax=Drosophila rhopaloa TaxID=1041015 RepID=A0A6P4ETA0_DRORH|nr:uncharacterized protein LOC108045211 isoform X3 [Drosophila rhopaloa]XP_016979931.1 uncharacterized protein LOC108045211 isoform X3 [Drosophila rhopaloa]
MIPASNRSQSMNPANNLRRRPRTYSENRKSQDISPALLDPLDPRRIQQQMLMVFVRIRPGCDFVFSQGPSTSQDSNQSEERRRRQGGASAWMEVRPPNTVLITRSALPSAPDVATGPPRVHVPNPSHDIEFRFRRVFGERATQAQVFRALSEPTLRQLYSGGSGLILLTGAAGTGKTHTLFGVGHSPAESGLLRRIFDAIFRSTGSDLVDRYMVEANETGEGFTAVPARAAQKMAAQEDLFMQNAQTPGTAAVRPFCRWQWDGVKIKVCNKRHSCFISMLIVQEGNFYDLFDSNDAEVQRPAPMGLREDRRGRCFAVGANRLEIRSVEEADLMVQAGLNKREAYSVHGGSHLVINIYLVFFDDSRNGKQLESGHLCIAEVLAPRAVHTANTRRPCGALKTVYTLRNCLNVLQRNQLAVLKGKPLRQRPPFRECSLTQLLRHFFDVKHLASVVCLATIGQTSEQALENIRALRFAEETIYIRDDDDESLASRSPVEEPEFVDEEEEFVSFLDKNFRPNYCAIRTVTPIVLPPFNHVQSLISLLKGRITRRKQLMQSSSTLSAECLERLEGTRDEVLATQATALKELEQSNYEIGSLLDQLELVHEPIAYGKLSVQAQQAEKRAQISENLLHGRNEQLKRHISLLERQEVVEPSSDARKRKAQNDKALRSNPIWHHY